MRVEDAGEGRVRHGATSAISMRRSPAAFARSCKRLVTTSFGHPRGIADFQTHGVGADPQSRPFEDFRHAARDAVAQQQGPPEDPRAASHAWREEADRGRQARIIRFACVARVNRGGEEDAFSVVEADEGQSEQPPEALRRPDVGVIAPGDVGEGAGCHSQPPVAGRFTREQILGPGRESRPETGNARLRNA